MIARLCLPLGVALLFFCACGACSSSKPSNSATSGSGGSGGSSGGGVQPGEDGGLPGSGTPIGQTDGGVPTKLPSLPTLTNVIGIMREDSVGLDFDPVDGALDYRVYALPNDQDITVNGDGSITAKNAVYRCAGLRQTYDLPNNQNKGNAGLVVSNGQYAWTAQIPSTPTLGYVYVTPASDRLPVYAVAGYTNGYEIGWRESRLKVYTTDSGQRQTLLSQKWRDDGIAFYVPSASSSMTQTIYSSQTAQTVPGKSYSQYSQYYFTAADMGSHSGDTTPPAPAFQVLTAPANGTKPLMAVLYQTADPHIELAVGQERYKRAANQGNGPLWHLEWSGITQPTVLVVEALDSGCPYRGFLAAQHLDAPPHQTFDTLDDLKAASASGEVYVNGQYDTMTTPKAVARSFVQVAPQPHNPADWDFYQGFAVGSDLAPSPVSGCTDYNCERWQSTDFVDISAYRLDEPMGIKVATFGPMLGQLWIAYDDAGQDVTGKMRFTARPKGNVDSDPTKFLHATMSVDIVSTDRRYPQLIISDQNPPVQEGLSNPNNNTLLIQSITGPSMRIEAQAIHGLVNGHPWDVNNQAPEHRFIDCEMDQMGTVLLPTDTPFEHAGMDRLTRFDLYVSTQRAYVFLDGRPAGCTRFPSNFALQGAVTVTVGDVLYHEGAPDELICADPKPYSFMHVHQCDETKRHFDDVAFKSGVPAPTWDESKLPCGAY